MLLKRGVSEDVYGTAPQRLRARAKAGLPESQCPVVETHALRYASRVWTPMPSGAPNSPFVRGTPCPLDDRLACALPQAATAGE